MTYSVFGLWICPAEIKYLFLLIIIHSIESKSKYNLYPILVDVKRKRYVFYWRFVYCYDAKNR